MGHCRLCHGKFSSRSLRSITDRSPGEGPERSCPGQRVFIRDFQRLLGVAVHQDPALSEFVCRNCHAQFYQCHSLLESFLQRVNVSPMGQQKLCPKVGAQPPTGPEEAVFPGDRITSSSWCLHGLVGWVHGHAGSCGALPSLQRTLASEYCGIIQAVWSCDQGHTYTMDTDASCRAFLLDSTLSVKWAWDKEMASSPSGTGSQVSQARGTTVGVETKTLPSMEVAPPPPDGNPLGPGPGPPPQPSPRLSGAPGQLGEKQVPSPTSDDRVKDEFSDLSEGDFLSEDENNKSEHSQSSDTHTEPRPEKKVSSRKNESREDTKAEEPKIRKKPGPKPGWKKQLRCEREELPTIYKCPYQGCTAVYRGADGMKKHIKEHHEEVRERPCPHPGCNKVFMIDRYLQRHVKLIHTEVRNYICDECGQTFKQRKHLLVHKMRHSGAKPLQTEPQWDKNSPHSAQEDGRTYQSRAPGQRSQPQAWNRKQEPPGPEEGAWSACTYQVRVDQMEELLTGKGDGLLSLEVANKNRRRQAEEHPWRERAMSEILPGSGISQHLVCGAAVPARLH